MNIGWRWRAVCQERCQTTPPAYFGVAIASSLLALSAFGVPLVARELDLPIPAPHCRQRAHGRRLPVTATQPGDACRSARGCGAPDGVFLAQVPLAFALLVGVISAGSLRADDFASVQAGMPWRFLAFASPIHFMALRARSVCAGPRGDLGLPTQARACRELRTNAGRQSRPSSGRTSC